MWDPDILMVEGLIRPDVCGAKFNWCLDEIHVIKCPNRKIVIATFRLRKLNILKWGQLEL
jgi:hypothetical protein